MIRTKTFTQVTVRLMTFVFNACYVIEATVKSPKAAEVVRYCVPEKLLRQLTIWGMKDGHAEARLDTEVDYALGDESPQLRTTFCSGRDFGGTERGPGDPLFSAASDRELCKIWKEAVDWFTEICAQQGLELIWTVSFMAKHEEMCRKFDLVTVTIDDRTVDTPAHMIPSSVVPGADLIVRFARTICPSGK